MAKITDTEVRKKFIDAVLSFLAFYETKWNDKQKTKSAALSTRPKFIFLKITQSNFALFFQTNK